MNAFAKTAALALLTSAVATPAFAADYYKTSFNSMPGAFTVMFGDGATPGAAYYSRVDLTKAWSVGQIGKHGYAAICPTRSHDAEYTYKPTGIAQDSRMISPAITVNSADARITWDARSLHPDFPESYRVMVSTDGGDTYSEVYAATAESQLWTSHSVSLAAYVGRDVRVGFFCNTVDGFMLCVDELEIGVPATCRFNTVNSTRHFVAEAPTAPVTVDVTVVGKALEGGKAYIVANGETVGTTQLPAVMKSGDSTTLTFDIPLTLNAVTTYAVHVTDTAGTDETIVDDKVMCSNFARRLIVDKATGIWCVNCPNGEVILQHLEETYGDEVIALTTHTGDALGLGSYFKNLGFSAVPMFMVNRDASTVSSTNAGFDTAFAQPTVADIAVAARLNSDNTLSVTADMKFAADWDNSADRYRVGYTITRDYYDPDNELYVQTNSAIANAEQYSFMPGYVLSDMMHYRHVTVDNTAAFTGVASTLPAAIHAGDSHTATFSVKLPSAITDPTQARLVAYVLDTETGYIHNADAIDLASLAAVDAITFGTDNTLSLTIGGSICHVHGASSAVTLEAYTPDGRLVARQTRRADGGADFDLGATSGLLVVRVTDGYNILTKKISL